MVFFLFGLGRLFLFFGRGLGRLEKPTNVDIRRGPRKKRKAWKPKSGRLGKEEKPKNTEKVEEVTP